MYFGGWLLKKGQMISAPPPAVFLAEKLLKEGAFIRVYDPHILNQEGGKTLAYKIFKESLHASKKHIVFCRSPEMSLKKRGRPDMRHRGNPKHPLKRD